MLTRKQLCERTKIPSSTLGWLLNKLDIQPTQVKTNLFGRPIYYYDNSVIESINAWLNKSLLKKKALSEGKHRCQGGCNQYYEEKDMISVYCKSCYCKKVILNLVMRNAPWKGIIDKELVEMAQAQLTNIQEKLNNIQ